MKLRRIFIQDISQWSRSRPLSILGPTGSGKTSTLLKFLREHSLQPHLVSLDSVAAYRELDIGSSKPLGADYSDFSWAGINVINPDKKITAAKMRAALPPNLAGQKDVVFIGGTHFYERFIIEGAAPGEASDPEYLAELKREGSAGVLAKLIATDSQWGDFLHPNDEFRIFRYGDLVLRQGLDFSALRQGSQNPLFPEVECLVLNVPKEILEARLLQRIDEMFAQGWLDEVKALILKYGSRAPALQSVGYVEIVDFLKHSQNDDVLALKEKILIRHRQLAKQQRTWLRKVSTIA